MKVIFGPAEIARQAQHRDPASETTETSSTASGKGRLRRGGGLFGAAGMGGFFGAGPMFGGYGFGEGYEEGYEEGLEEGLEGDFGGGDF